MELIPEMGMGSIPTCMHNGHPGKGGYDSAISDDQSVLKDCPLNWEK
jgi:hypothetical protein